MKEHSKLARKYDKQAWFFNRQPKDSRLNDWRQRLLRDAKGDVLELAAGTGANFPYYPQGVSVTAVDISSNMLQYAKKNAKKAQIDASFILGNVEEIEFPEHRFDTIVSTLSFCGYEHPISLFNQLADWLKPGGQILLLEHGISTQPILKQVLKVLDPVNHQLVGCHLKRDMQELIEISRLDIVHMESHLKGIIRLMWVVPET
ncbi:MAG TPA: class I SAM-dependent methyltransferase [Pseudogracilibacillus sp.]|nr:class I SAM-dependent methyltransferase [Pseudogracilibacillus sp.]